VTNPADDRPLPTSPDKLYRFLAAGEPEEVRKYLFVPRAGVPYATGTGARLLTPQYRPDDSTFLVPGTVRRPQPIDLIYTYVTLDEYAFPADRDVFEVVSTFAETLARSGSLRQRLTDLAVLGHLTNNFEKQADLGDEYARFLRPDLAERLRNVLRATDSDPQRWLLSRQGVLVAVSHVLSHLHDTEFVVQPSLVGAITLVHAVSASLYSNADDAEPGATLAGMPAGLAMEIVRNELFNEVEEPLSLLNRAYQIWTRYADQLSTVTLRKPPGELLREATELDLFDWLSFGFGLWLQRQQWEPGQPMWVNPGWFSMADPKKRETFFEHVASEPSELATTVGPPWGFLSLQRTPVITMSGDYLVMDDSYLFERVTAGLYWDVHDSEKSRIGEHARHLWTQAYGEMLELYVLDLLQRLAPPALGGGTNLYREADFRSAYSGKTCDAGIDFGTDFCAIEVVSGQVQVSTRIEGDPSGFESDTDRLVIKKARQLHETSSFLLARVEDLTGPRQIGRTRILPVIVNAGTYPVNPISMAYVDMRLEQEGLLQDPRLGHLCIVDVSELEILEGFAGSGLLPMHLALRAWKDSDLANVSLKNYLLSRYAARRPDRVKKESEELLERMIERLGLREGSAE